MSKFHRLISFTGSFLLLFFMLNVTAQITPVGEGSYTNIFPGTDAAGRNGYPSGTPQLYGNATGRPVPTNDWWSALIKQDHAGNLFNYPMAMKTMPSGLMMSYIPFGVLDDQEPIVIGVSGLNATHAAVSDYSDWTVTMDWSGEFRATTGTGMPFVYFEKGDEADARVQINLGTVTVTGATILVTDARNGADFAIYAPTGSTWTRSGSTYTSSLGGKNYWSAAMLPQGTEDPAGVADAFRKYAFVFPSGTTVDWTFDENSSVMRTNFSVTTDIMEGTETELLLGLLPHQWAHLADDSSQPGGYVYTSIRGELKMLEGNAFSVENRFHGILPTLPYLANYSDGFNPAELDRKVWQLAQEGLATWTDSYNEGQVMNRLIQTARIADQAGNAEVRDRIVATIRERLEDWLTAEASEVAFIFYYNPDWSALLGYPAGHGQDVNINDHHFHWGYFIHAAAFLEQFEPGWAAEWGDMVNLLVRDAATPDRSDPMFPFLRNFSPYAGHCWANGFATFPQGNDQESTSESMQFNSSLIHWGSITGNDEIRDLGIYLYTTEQSAIEEYWFDQHGRILPPSHPYALVSRVWGNSYDNGTFWTSDIEASYGIELYPIHGGSMYLAHNPDYIQKLWTEIEQNTGILDNDDNVNLWHDVMWKYLAFYDPGKAIDLYDGYPDREMKFGISDAQTYYWLHVMNAMGSVNAELTADHSLAVAFDKEGTRTYAAHNYGDTPLTVTFSDGYILTVPAGSMATSRDSDISGSIASSFPTVYPGGSVELSVNATGGTPGKVEFYRDGMLLGEDLSAPFQLTAEGLNAGVYRFYAKVYSGEAFSVTNILTVVSGSQRSYPGSPSVIPGTLEAGHFDEFPGGSGQGIAYLDYSPGNNGDFRTGEDVDVSDAGAEGTAIGWISAGEWVEYTVDVTQSGFYDLAFRHASGNESGGGPFHLELNGERITEDIHVGYTGDWDEWASATVSGLAFPEGRHVLRLVFDHGEFNLAGLTFTYRSELNYGPPLANAGDNVSVTLPATSAFLDGSLSVDPDGDQLTYQWTQVNGPSLVEFSDQNSVTPEVSNLEKGIYTLRLVVSDGAHVSADEVYIIVSETGNSAPTISIIFPLQDETFEEGSDMLIQVLASDLEGEIASVAFYDGTDKIGEEALAPFSFLFNEPAVGSHKITAVATDGSGATGSSDTLNVFVAEVKECRQTLQVAQQGSFSKGYACTYKTVGTNVSVTFELLDTDKSGVVAFLWQESPFSERQMEHVSGNTFTSEIRGVEPGSMLSYACKFAYAGGMSVTRYVSYEVGSECEDVIDDTTSAGPGNPVPQAPLVFPNPVSGKLTIRFPADAGTVKVSLVSITGIMQDIQIENHAGNAEADLSHLAAGIYYLVFDYASGPVYQKIIKR